MYIYLLYPIIFQYRNINYEKLQIFCMLLAAKILYSHGISVYDEFYSDNATSCICVRICVRIALLSVASVGNCGKYACNFGGLLRLKEQQMAALFCHALYSLFEEQYKRTFCLVRQPLLLPLFSVFVKFKLVKRTN